MLTELTLRKLSPASGTRVEVWDEKIPGFGVRVSASGTKSFVLMYYQSGRKKRVTLGRYPILTLAEARALARSTLNRVAHGEEPQSAASRQSFLFEQVVEEFIDTYAAQHYRPSHRNEMARLLRSRFVSKWRGRQISEIGRADVISMVEGVAKDGAPSAANHSLAAIRKLFNWCEDRGLIASNPAAKIKRPAPVLSRDRVLDDAEVVAIWKATAEIGAPFEHIVRLLLLTAQRRGEVCGMKWSELNFEKATWSIPAERTKSNRAQTLPLSPLAMTVIKSVPNVHDIAVFPARGNDSAHPSGFSKIKRRLDQMSGVSGWTLHDLRRTAATHMASLGVAPHVIERILNHTSGLLGGVAGIYNRFQYQPEMRAALDVWASQIERLASGR